MNWRTCVWMNSSRRRPGDDQGLHISPLSRSTSSPKHRTVSGQGDVEKERGIPVQVLNDREKVNRPNSQAPRAGVPTGGDSSDVSPQSV